MDCEKNRTHFQGLKSSGEYLAAVQQIEKKSEAGLICQFLQRGVYLDKNPPSRDYNEITLCNLN